MLPDPQDTIVALASAPGPGGRAIVRLSGPAAMQILTTVFESRRPLDGSRRQLHEGSFRLPGLATGLPGEAYIWQAPHSYTGQEMVEIHTLSCPPLIDLLISQLLNAGCRAAERGEFTLRAFLAGKIDLTQAEAVVGIIEADTRDDLKRALAQLAGGLAQPLQSLREDLLNLLADIEAGLDFADEDITFVQQEDLLNRLTRGLAQLTLLQKQLGERAVNARPFRVALSGRPNAGKSSLFNALSGRHAALVSARPGTTRDYLVQHLSLEGMVIELVDTAGVQAATDSINEQAQSLGREETEQADLVLLCLEAGQSLTTEDRRPAGHSGKPALVAVSTKTDRAPGHAGMIATSSVTGAGLDEVRALLVQQAKARRSSGLAPGLSRCRHHVVACIDHLRRAHGAVLYEEPQEMLALELRGALDQLGEMVGAVYNDDLLDRIFSRFCIGK